MLGAATPPQSTLKPITSCATGGDAIHNKLKVADVVLPRVLKELPKLGFFIRKVLLENSNDTFTPFLTLFSLSYSFS